MTTRQWALWLLGWVASVLVLLVVAFLKGGPLWYGPVFAVAGLFCLVATLVSKYLKRTQRVIRNKEGWIEALTTTRLGFLGLIAMVVFVMGTIALRVWK